MGRTKQKQLADILFSLCWWRAAVSLLGAKDPLASCTLFVSPIFRPQNMHVTRIASTIPAFH